MEELIFLNKRPTTIRRDKYALYDDVIKLKLANNILTCENVQLLTINSTNGYILYQNRIIRCFISARNNNT